MQTKNSQSGSAPITLSSLCQWCDEELIEQVYQHVLNRPVDNAGKEHYLPLLRSGQLTKERVIANIRYSPEGVQNNVAIKGLKKYQLINKALNAVKKSRALSILKPVIEAVESYLRWVRLSQQFQQHENKLVQTEKENKRQFQAHQQLKERVDGLANTISELTKTVQQQKQQLQSSGCYVQSLQNTISNLIEQYKEEGGEKGKQKMTEQLQSEQENFLDLMYVAFEDHFRGTTKEIKQQMEVYLPYIKECYQADKPVLDIGCGRGEWLALLSDNEFDAKGVDLNKVMVSQAQQQGLNAQNIDAVTYMKALPDNSLSAVTGIHLVEHLPFESLIRLLQEALRTLKHGGVAIFETPNPENIFVGSLFFYTDPTHNNPLVPQTMQFILEYIGYQKVEIKRLHTYAEISKAAGKPRDQTDSFKNNHFYNAMDYAVIAYK